MTRKIKIKIMIVGLWKYEIYEKSFALALEENGIEIICCKLNKFFDEKFGQFRLAIPLLNFLEKKINMYILKLAKLNKPDFVFFWRPTYINTDLLKKLYDLNIKTVSYNNDDPFNSLYKAKGIPWYYKFLWQNYLKCLPYFDKNFFYRKINVEEAYLKGVKHASILMPYFLPKKNVLVKLSNNEKKIYKCDVTFVGHYEPDEREKYIATLIDNNIDIKIWGSNWNNSILTQNYSKLYPIKKAEGIKYQKALCGAEICLVFLSKLNRDTYTRRCFEITASGKLMLAERTKDLMNMFEENKEACFFSSKEELIRKTKWLLKNPMIRKRIANEGLKRVWNDKHDVINRAKQFLEKIK